MHHRVSDAHSLIPRKNTDRAERSDRMSRNRRPTADDVASQMIITNGHERQAGDDVACVDQSVEESNLGWHRVGRVRTTKGLRMDLAHLVRVRGLVPSNQHRWSVTLARLSTRVQVVRASGHGHLDRQAQSLLRLGTLIPFLGVFAYRRRFQHLADSAAQAC